MKMNEIRRVWLQEAIVTVLIGTIGGGFFSYFLSNQTVGDFIMGCFVGVSLSLLIPLYTAKISKRILSKLNFLLKLFIDTFAYILIVVVVLSFYVIFFAKLFGVIEFNTQSLSDFFNLPEYRTSLVYTSLFTFTLSFIINFINAVRELLGQKVLGRLLIGLYHKPREEKRIFMFLDIKGSTTIAENIGHMRFLSLLDDFFYDISNPVIACKAEIYKYVGDEAILTWKWKDGITNANCIRCYFGIAEEIEKLKNKYQKKYGLIPTFKAALHGGIAVTGEMGLYKKEIAYIGDVLNTTARIEGECRNLKKDFIVSGDIVDAMTLPADLVKEDFGIFKLRGKENEIKLYGISQKI